MHGWVDGVEGMDGRLRELSSSGRSCDAPNEGSLIHLLIHRGPPMVRRTDNKVARVRAPLGG